MILNVPYHSQFTDISDPYWMLRGCSIVCLKMVLGYYGKNREIMDLINEGKEAGGYGKSGWFQDAVVALAKANGVNSFRKEGIDENLGVEEIRENLDKGNPVIISGVKHFMEQTKFHLVVITGYEEEEGKLSGFYYHDPENTDKNRAENDRERGYNRFVSLENFKKDWRKMAIYFEKIK